MPRPGYLEDASDEKGDGQAVGLVVGLLVFLLVVGLIGWHTRPAPVVYSNPCRRYIVGDEDDEWGEGFEPATTGDAAKPKPGSPQKKAVKAGSGWKSNKKLDQASHDAIKAAIAKRVNKRPPKPVAKPAAPVAKPKPAIKPAMAAPSPPPKRSAPEGFSKAQDADKKRKVTMDVVPVKVTTT